jgi:hypothetical protein
VAEKRAALEEWSKEEGVTVTELLGYLLHLENYHTKNRAHATLGWQLFTGEKISGKPEVSLNEAVWMIERGRLSHITYLEIRLRFLDRIIFPSVKRVIAENKMHRPELTEYQHGVQAPLSHCLYILTMLDRLSLIDMTSLEKDGLQISFKFTWGLDGSGDHSDYNQLSKVDFTTKQVMSVCFSLKEVTVEDVKGHKEVWSSTTGGHNKPQNVRPLAIFPAKETKDLLQDFVPRWDYCLFLIVFKCFEVVMFIC